VTFLLDVNVLIALMDVEHVSHDVAHDWFSREGSDRWATCPITENGLVRILSNPKYPNARATPREALDLLAKLTRLPGHEFWPDEISLTDTYYINPAYLLISGQITDTYLLALSVRKGGKLATLDRRLATLAVHMGAESLRVIGASH
jgi:toxin-antitoxin system PIN domain toxin